VAGSYSASGTTGIDGGATFTGTVSSLGNLQVGGGSADFSPAVGGPATLTLSSLGLRGTLSGTDSFVVNSPFTWQGTLLGPQGSSLTANGGVSISGGVTLDGRTLVNAGTAAWSNGSINVTDGGVLNNRPDATFGSPGNTSTLALNGGTLAGSGTVNANVSNNGQVNPGGSGAPGILTVNGSYTQSGSSVLNIGIGGPTPGSQYDQLNVNGPASLGGTLNVSILPNLDDICGGTFTVLNASPRSGTFATILGTLLPGGQTLTPTYGPSSVALTASLFTPTATVTSSADPSLLNQPLTITDTIGAPTGTSEVPTGTVQFQVDAVNVGSPVALSGGQATLSLSTLAVGPHTITASYSGDDCFYARSVSITQYVDYHFSGFLAPLQPNMTYAAGKTIPIKFQLTDFNSAYITSLSAVTSLQVLNGSGTDVLAGAGKAGLRYDPTANQFMYNWQTKGLAAGTYTVTLALNDGTTHALTLTLSSKGAFQLADGASSGYVSSAANQVLYGMLSVAVEDDTGAGIDQSELDRLSDAMTYLNTALGQFGVSLSWAAPGTTADVTIHFATSTPEGDAGDGVLGFTTADNNVYLVEGWSFYTGADATQVGAGQYDFQTLAEHELAHTVGLGESSDPGSVMYEYLAPGMARRTFTDANLTAINTDADRFMKVAPDAPRVGVEATVLTAAIPATSVALNPTNVAVSYGSVVSGDGAGTATTSVGGNGDAFGVANNTTLTLMDLLLAADAQAVNGILYNGNATKRNEANNMFSAVNQDGGIS
jgi:hypothetical protein